MPAFNSPRFNALSAAYHGWLVGTVSIADFAAATSRYMAEIEAEREIEREDKETFAETFTSPLRFS